MAKAAPTGSLPFLRIGPVLLALVTGLQFTFWAWQRWPHRTPNSAELDRLTLLGQAGYSPDCDMFLYLGGLCLSLIMALALDLLWRRQILAVRSENQRERVQQALLMHFPMAAFLAFLPLLYLPIKGLSLISGFLGLLFGGAALWAGSRSTLAMPRWLQWPRGGRRCVEAAFVVALVILIVYIPHTTELSSKEYMIDHYHHLDFYAMGPALAYRHGKALGTDSYSQYGVGWPVVLAFLSKVGLPLSYKLLLHVCVVWGCIYYLALYAFLRLLLRSGCWATVGLLLALILGLFSGTEGPPKWLWPSSTVMRYSMDVFLFLFCLLYARSGKAWLGLPAGLFAALAVLFGTDTGLYLLVCLGGYLLAVPRLQIENGSPRPVRRFAGWTMLGLAITLLGGLAIASRGTLLRPEFWMGWTESLRLFNDGFGHMPILGAVQGDRTSFVLLMVMLLAYLFAVGRMLQEFGCRRLTPEHLLVGLMGAYGFAVLLWFIGRSHPYNLHHATIPFCIVLTSFVVEICNAVRRRTTVFRPSGEGVLAKAIWEIVPLACAYGLLVGICVHPTFQSYPNVLRWLVEDRMKHGGVPDENYLFSSRRDGALPDEFREDIVRFKTVTAMMRTLSDGGRKSVALIDSWDTPYLVEADLRPHFRYSPVVASLLFQNQLEFLERQIVDDPPDYLLLPTTGWDVRVEAIHQSILSTVQRHFTVDRNVGNMVVYRRNDRMLDYTVRGRN